MNTRLMYPGFCARCGNRWGHHLTEIALKERGGCPFYAKPGEIAKPTLVPSDTQDTQRRRQS
jgi:hypothetical protein